MKDILFDVGEEHAKKILNNEEKHYEYPVFELDSGTWFGSIYAIIKIEPYKDHTYNVINDFETLENMYPELKEEKDIKDDFDEFLEELSLNKDNLDKIEFTDVIFRVDNFFGNEIARVYKIGSEIGVISTKYDYLTKDLQGQLDFVSSSASHAIIGVKPELKDRTLKERAVIILMPLYYPNKEIRESINKVRKGIQKLNLD